MTHDDSKTIFWKIHALYRPGLYPRPQKPGDLEDEFNSPAASKDAAKLTLLGRIFADAIHANRTPSSRQRPRQRPRGLAHSPAASQRPRTASATSRAIFLHSVRKPGPTGRPPTGWPSTGCQNTAIMPANEDNQNNPAENNAVALRLPTFWAHQPRA